MTKSFISLVGVAGFAGAGKTTAARYLSDLTGGLYLYLGQTVLDEVGKRKLLPTRENERQVRIELRRDKGDAVFAMPFCDKVTECARNGVPVFVDAIFTKGEFEVLASRVPTGCAHLLAVEASMNVRRARLASRQERPFNAVELQERDKTELERLGTGDVISSASRTIRNEGTFGEFYAQLAAFVNGSA
jgi:dephospho-CoA kinase